MQNLNEKDWNAIQLTTIFDKISRGKRLKKADHISGNIPYVSSTASQNGTDGSCGNSIGVRMFENCLTLANSGSVGACFYHPYRFIASDHVTALKRNNTCVDCYLSLSALISRLGEKYNFNREINDIRISRERIMLPVSNDGSPDYRYMAEYTQQKREAMLSRYRAYVEKRIAELGEPVEIPALNEKEWGSFFITSLFSSIVPGKGKGLNHLNKVTAGGINYIGATNRNNGVLCYIEENDYSRSMILDGNCIGFIKNGDGSAGFAIYKAEPFISTSDVLYGYAEWLNKFTGLFFIVAQDMIEHKYSHGYKRNKEHLASDKVMLPINENGKPDYKYMEQYSKNMMLKKYMQYFAYMDSNGGHRQPVE